MDKSNLTLSEMVELRKELTNAGVTIAKISTEIPANLLLTGKFQTQKRDEKTLEPVITCIEYTRNEKPMAFFAVKADMATDEKTYSNTNVGLTDELKELLSDSTNLVKDYAFRSKQGRVRTFVQVAEE